MCVGPFAPKRPDPPEKVKVPQQVAAAPEPDPTPKPEDIRDDEVPELSTKRRDVLTAERTRKGLSALAAVDPSQTPDTPQQGLTIPKKGTDLVAGKTYQNRNKMKVA